MTKLSNASQVDANQSTDKKVTKLAKELTVKELKQMILEIESSKKLTKLKKVDLLTMYSSLTSGHEHGEVNDSKQTIKKGKENASPKMKDMDDTYKHAKNVRRVNKLLAIQQNDLRYLCRKLFKSNGKEFSPASASFIREAMPKMEAALSSRFWSISRATFLRDSAQACSRTLSSHNERLPITSVPANRPCTTSARAH